MQLENTAIEGVKLIHQFSAIDHRGSFVKTFHQDSFRQYGIDFEMKESFYSISHQHVIRGLHFQHPPHDHAKIVFSIGGSILDTVLDIRKGSPTYGHSIQVELSASNHLGLFIPTGMAHGFKSLSDHSITFYLVSSQNHKGADDGIYYDSVGIDWQCPNPIVSDRDMSFVHFENFNSPFTY